MSNNQYFYLISGLPDLSLQGSDLPFSSKIFLDEMESKIEKEDFKLVCMLYYPKDNRNILQILFNKNDMMKPEGRYSLLKLKKGVGENVLLPFYMSDFITEFNENKNSFTETEWETKLTKAYFKETMNTRNEFLNQWMEFEFNLKNILLVLSNRKHALPFSDIVIEVNETATLLKQGLPAEFSTEPSLDFISQAVKIIETENLIDREKKIDALRWKKLEEMTVFNYFTVETILCFIIKLMIIERWKMLTQEEVKDLLPSMLYAFTEKIKIAEVEN